jgi:hypothetical protein
MRIYFSPEGRPLLHGARLKINAQGGIHVEPSASVAQILGAFPHGFAVAIEVNQATGKPVAIHLTPASSGEGTYLKMNGTPHFELATRKLFGKSSDCRSQYVEETVTQDHVIIPIPFKFRRSRRRARNMQAS